MIFVTWLMLFVVSRLLTVARRRMTSNNVICTMHTTCTVASP